MAGGRQGRIQTSVLGGLQQFLRQECTVVKLGIHGKSQLPHPSYKYKYICIQFLQLPTASRAFGGHCLMPPLDPPVCLVISGADRIAWHRYGPETQPVPNRSRISWTDTLSMCHIAEITIHFKILYEAKNSNLHFCFKCKAIHNSNL